MKLVEIEHQNVLVNGTVANVSRIGRNEAKKLFCDGKEIGIMPKDWNISCIKVIKSDGNSPLTELTLFCNDYRSKHNIKNKHALSFFSIEYLGV